MNYLSPSPTRHLLGSYKAGLRSGSNRHAFTLVEMLVVITIITILLTIGAMGLRNLGKSSGVSAGVPLAEAAFAEARAVSVGNGTTSRLLISADRDDSEKYLRYMLVVYEADDGRWIAAGRGMYLPEGVYFSQEYSKLNHEDGTGEIPELTGSDEEIYLREDSGVSNDNLSGPYFYYQFNSEGIANDAGASFVCGAGSLPPGAEFPRAGSGGGPKNFGGFMIWSKGTTSIFRHPDQIDIPSDAGPGDEF
ncbi:prepilin-type N-terminal cleavage/methylation domain-containing protein [Verrucomicrobiaceae bacterium R5-34]|uniref:Prepilin-type N-terminal cleavage/methylation domain-containing protein n=1 Tax=Oceaniferula flava TaxID=2800421 RepID=A0AAE2SB58_9BACT|nr:prepilin-type N-terminal cleavage/methylation domain-containing protein [Oceaniferula flavus]MBK1831549.1 prepilin-type N-terminal cleavage/methylation domain-containing protein [Verrucomicrobiaceae bacterium R5-34]MBK1854212.1 prepilin-type N-terminal cleavage/methylation domain-containing protein [Oceaniferula flavus]MBM1135518.1 prepilin-type N-terminal cleavage/methylation domain-containing protein [Oceaniferula flavus]